MLLQFQLRHQLRQLLWSNPCSRNQWLHLGFNDFLINLRHFAQKRFIFSTQLLSQFQLRHQVRQLLWSNPCSRKQWLHLGFNDFLINLRHFAQKRFIFSTQLLSQFQLRHQVRQLLWSNPCSRKQWLHLGFMIFWSTWGILPRSGLYFPPNCFRNFNWGIRCASSCEPTHAAGSDDCILALMIFDQPMRHFAQKRFIFSTQLLSQFQLRHHAPAPVIQPMQQEAVTASWLYDFLINLRHFAQKRFIFSTQLLSQFQLRHQVRQLRWSNPCSRESLTASWQFQLRHQVRQLLWSNPCSRNQWLHLGFMIFWSTWGILPRSGLYFPPNCFRNFNWGIRCASSCDPTHAAGSNDCILALWFLINLRHFAQKQFLFSTQLLFNWGIRCASSCDPTHAAGINDCILALWFLINLRHFAQKRFIFSTQLLSQFQLRHQVRQLPCSRWSNPCSIAFAISKASGAMIQPALHLGFMIFWSTWGILPRSGFYFPPNCFRNFNWGIRCASSCDPTHAAGINDCILALWFFDQPEAFCPEAVYIFHPIAFAISIEAAPAPVIQPMQQQPMPAPWLHDALNSLRLSAHQRLLFSQRDLIIGLRVSDCQVPKTRCSNKLHFQLSQHYIGGPFGHSLVE